MATVRYILKDASGHCMISDCGTAWSFGVEYIYGVQRSIDLARPVGKQSICLRGDVVRPWDAFHTENRFAGKPAGYQPVVDLA